MTEETYRCSECNQEFLVWILPSMDLVMICVKCNKEAFRIGHEPPPLEPVTPALLDQKPPS